MNKTIAIDALDSLFFRDGRPFSMGDENWADAIFPPYPSTIYGMLRSVCFENNMAALSKANATGDPTEGLLIKHYCLHLSQKEKNTFLFPAPQDYVHEDSSGLAALSFEKRNKDVIANSETFSHSLVYNGSAKVQELDSRYYVSGEQIKAYLKGEVISQVINLDDHITEEPKIGIGRNYHSGRSEDGQLYRIAMKRLNGEWKNSTPSTLQMIVGYEGIELPEEHINRLGGEGKLVKLSSLKEEIIEIPQPAIQSELVKMYVATPAIFMDGWLPAKLLNKSNIQIAAAAFGKPQNIGGWDIKKKEPKPMLKAVPAGAVYYLKGDTEALSKFVSKFHGNCLAGEGIDEEYSKQGFGLVYFGITTNKKS